MSAQTPTLLGRFHAKYSSSMERRPMLTLCCANATLACLSDLLAQAVPHMYSQPYDAEGLTTLAATPPNLPPAETPSYDWKRTLRMSVYGGGIAPVIQTWFLTLDKWFPLPASNSSAKIAGAVARRVAADQIIYAPVGLAAFFGVMATLEGVDVKQRFRDAYAPAVIANYQVWPLVQFFNFRFCPVPYRVPFVGSIGVIWTAYLSQLNARVAKKEATYGGS